MILSFQSKSYLRIFSFFLIAICYTQQLKSATSIEIMQVYNLDQLKNFLSQGGYALLYYGSETCPACKSVEINNILPHLKAANPDLLIIKAVASKNPLKDIREHFAINAFPTFIFFKDGEKVSQIIGAQANLQKEIDNLRKNSKKSSSQSLKKTSKATTKKTIQPVIRQQETQNIPSTKSHSAKTNSVFGKELIELLSADKFEELKKQSRYKVLDIYTVWCGPCKQLKPIFAQCAQEYDAIFISIDAERFAGVIAPFGINSYPTVIILDPNNKVIKRISGFGGESLFRRQLDQALGKNPQQVIIKEECIRMN